MDSKLYESLTTPTGWLINLKKKLVIFFIKDPHSLRKMPKVITQLWHATDDGVPKQIKNIRTIALVDAIETWNELLVNGWEFIEYQIDKDPS